MLHVEVQSEHASTIAEPTAICRDYVQRFVLSTPMASTPRMLPRWLLTLAGLGALGFLMVALRGVLTPLFLAFLIAYVLDPLVDRMQARGMPRALGILVLLFGVLGVLTLFLLLVVPTVVRELAAFFAVLPGRVTAWLHQIEPVLAGYGVTLPHSVDELVGQLPTDVGSVAGSALSPATAVLRWLVGGTASVIGAVMGASIVPIFAFYLLYDFDRIVTAIGDLVPRRHRASAGARAREVDRVLGQWIRGQLTVMLVLGTLYAVGFSLAGVRLAVLIGILGGLLAFIPYVGGATALGLALLMCAFDFRGPMQLVEVVAVFAIVQTLDGLVITPKVVGNKVGLPALGVLVALMAFGQLFGFLGVLLAVPAAAVLKIFANEALVAYRKSDLYLEPALADAVAVSEAAPLAAAVAAPEPEPEPERAVEEQPEPERAVEEQPEPAPEPERAANDEPAAVTDDSAPEEASPPARAESEAAAAEHDAAEGEAPAKRAPEDT